MRAFACGLLLAGMLVGLIGGCEKPQPEPVAAQPPPEPSRDALPTYPQDQIPAADPQPERDATHAAAVDEPPVDTSVTETEEAPAPKPKRSYAPAEKKAARTHTVRKGETLQKISMKYYGTTKNWHKIFKANPKLKDPDELQVGTKLVIP